VDSRAALSDPERAMNGDERERERRNVGEGQLGRMRSTAVLVVRSISDRWGPLRNLLILGSSMSVIFSPTNYGRIRSTTTFGLQVPTREKYA
jgi:hypothetical protein